MRTRSGLGMGWLGNETQLRCWESFRRSEPRRSRSWRSPKNVGGVWPFGLQKRFTKAYADRMNNPSWRRARPCAWRLCLKPFRPVRREQDFCSAACRLADWREGQRAAPRGPLRRCEHCHGTIGPEMRSHARYCSGACRAAAQRARQAVSETTK